MLRCRPVLTEVKDEGRGGYRGEYKNDFVEFKPFLDIESIYLSTEQWPIG